MFYHSDEAQTPTRPLQCRLCEVEDGASDGGRSTVVDRAALPSDNTFQGRRRRRRKRRGRLEMLSSAHYQHRRDSRPLSLFPPSFTRLPHTSQTAPGDFDRRIAPVGHSEKSTRRVDRNCTAFSSLGLPFPHSSPRLSASRALAILQVTQFTSLFLLYLNQICTDR